MPGNDLDAELDADLNGGLDAELDAELDADLGVAPAGGKVIEMPMQQVQGALPKPREVPWYESLARGAYQGATLGFGDELAGTAVDALSGTEGNVSGVREDNAAAQQQNPYSFGAGSIAGAAPAAVATAGGSLPVALGANAAAVAAGKLGNAEGSLPERALQVTDDISEHPIRTGAELAAPAVGKYVGGALGSVAGKLKNKGNELLTHSFLNSSQRAKLLAKKGPEALSELGQDAQDAGLFKPRAWYEHLYNPRNARQVADNASRVKVEAGQGIGKFEDDLAARGVNPDVPVSQISEGLRGKAGQIRNALDLDAPGDARYLSKLANQIEQPEDISVAGQHIGYPREAPPALPAAQQGLPGVDAGTRTGALDGQRNFDFAPPPAEAPASPQMSFDMPRAAPEAPYVPGSLEGEQLSLPLQRPGNPQMSLGLDQGAQRSIPFDQSPGQLPLRSPARSAGGGDPQGALFPGDMPRTAPSAVGPQPPSQEALDLGTQGSFDFPPPAAKEAPWSPGQTSAQQTELGLPRAPVAQGRLPFMGADKQLDLPLPERQVTPLDATGLLSRDAIPFTDAIKSKRYIADLLKFDKGTPPKSYGKEAARQYTWAELKNSIERSLKNSPEIPKEDLSQYFKNNKDFSTAMSVMNPAMKMAEQQGQTGLSLGDLMAGASFGAPAALGAKATKGLLSGAAANTAFKASSAIGAAGKAAAPSAIAVAQQENPGASKEKLEKAANSKVKDDLQILLRDKKQP